MKKIIAIIVSCLVAASVFVSCEKEELKLEETSSFEGSESEFAPDYVSVGLDTSAISTRSGINTYPYGNGTCTSAGDPWNMVKKQCTSYAAWKMNEMNDNSPTSGGSYPFRSQMAGSGSNLLCTQNSGALSHACRWAMRLQSLGYFVSSTPTPGAIAHWNANESGVSSYGHVAFVESVNGNQANISEYNRTGNCTYGTRTVTAPRYIRFNRFMISGNVTINPNPIVQGQAVTVTLQVKNNFNEAVTSNFRCALYSSSNVYLGDIQIRSNENFSANQTKTLTFTKSSISSAPGSYKIWIESRVSSNSPWTLLHKPNATSTVNVSIVSSSSSSKPDLVVLSQSAPSSAARGSTISVSCVAKNIGSANAGSSYVKYYLSTNSTYSSGDIYLDYDPVSSLAPNATSPESESFVIPTTLSSGTWYLLFKADANNQVNESNENNNVAYKVISIN